MPKNNSVISTLFNVLSSSTRRKPVYIRQQALVSLLYPYFFKDTSKVIQEIYEADLIYIPPPPEIDVEDLSLVDQFIYSAELKSILVGYPIEDAQIAQQSIYSANFASILVNYAVTDPISINQNIYSVAFSLIGLYIDFGAEVSGVEQSIYQAYFGAP